MATANCDWLLIPSVCLRLERLRVNHGPGGRSRIDRQDCARLVVVCQSNTG